MEQRLSIVTLGVVDLIRSREFYERLGWRRSMKNSDSIVFYQAGGMALALYARQELAKDAGVAGKVRASGASRLPITHGVERKWIRFWYRPSRQAPS